MKKKYKELLLIDLSARLRYGVKILIENDNEELPYRTDKAYVNTMDEKHWSCFRFDRITITPYLRLLSSMTEEERAEFYKVGGLISHKVETDTYVLTAFSPDAYDWLNAHHFDYRGLIEKGLALVAPDGMYN